MSRYDFTAPRLFIEPTTDGFATSHLIGLDKAQHNYLCNVLRLSEGDPILVFNGRDGEWRGTLRAASRKQMTIELNIQTREQTASSELHYLFAPLKHARLDYMVQKAVEMGAGTIGPVVTRRTQATRINLDRMRANAIEAAEQCGILGLPTIAEQVPLARLLADWNPGRTMIFCDEDAPLGDAMSALSHLRGAMPNGPLVSVLIGPEGGFDDQERALLLALPSVIRLSLGPRILRADTAGVAALALVQAAIGDWTG